MDYLLSLEGFARVLTVIALSSSILFVIMMIMLIFGFGDHDIDPGADGADFHDMTSHNIGGLKLFSIRSILAFFCIGSWSALTALWMGSNIYLATFLGMIFGAAAGFIVALVLKFAMGLEQSGNIDVKNSIGHTATVYLPVGPGRANFGKVNILIQERLCELNAVTDLDVKLKTGETVLVTGVDNSGNLVVTSVND